MSEMNRQSTTTAFVKHAALWRTEVNNAVRARGRQHRTVPAFEKHAASLHSNGLLMQLEGM
jgi:hypothetical protein